MAVLIGVAAAGFTTSAQAQTAATCGITGSATASPAVYDPFNPSGLASTTITMNLTRVNGSGGQKTDRVNFFLRSNNANADGSSLTPTSAVLVGSATGLGLDIFYDYTEAPPIYAPTTVSPSSANRFLKLEFTGNNAASDVATIVFNVSLPPNLNLNAVQSLAFDAIFACSTTGGGPATQQTGTIHNAVVFPVTVLSALRTYYAGTALDFGEIGNITTASLGTTPKVTTDPLNYIFVQSSGAYSVALTSANGFKLKRLGATTINDEVKYQLNFLGQTPSTASPTFTTQTCKRAGLATAGEQLPIQAQLLEGGAGKTPAPSYTDTLTVTITPLIYNAVATVQCGSL